jgi:hypothetical protein
MNRFQHLIKNAGPSVSGLARLAVSAPVFAAKLLVLRSLFFRFFRDVLGVFHWAG